MKTNAVRLLDNAGIQYELRNYEVDPGNLTAIKVAAQIGLPGAQVFKTLVAKGDLSGVVLAVVPGDREIDLKALARSSGNRQMELVPVSQLHQLTGYVRGGVTALACKRRFPVFIDNSCMLHSVISVSAGVRGTQILLSPSDYVHYLQASLADLCRPMSLSLS